jgi:predicted flap endonuclease-1-like 5' DNA nuclease
MYPPRTTLILEEENPTMLRKLGMLFLLAFSGLSLTGFSTPTAALAEEEGNPWWIWILIFVALVAFVAFVLWWWMRSGEEEEEEIAPPTASKATAERIPAEEPADDLKRVEGIGPKISSVLQAAGIATFAQLADTDVDRLEQILAESDPNLLRLANPSTWPEQAKLAAEGQWEALEKLQDELKGGRRT